MTGRSCAADMADLWICAPKDASIGDYELSPSKQSVTAMFSPLAQSKSSYNDLTAFCTDNNVNQCVTYVNQELDSLGLCVYVDSTAPGAPGLTAVPALNAFYELLQIHRRDMTTMEELERDKHNKSSILENVQRSNSRLKDQLELLMREKSGLHETERQLQLKIKTLQSFLKSEKQEVQKLQSIIASRATQYSHDAKRKERDTAKLKERLSQLLVDRKDKKISIDVLNCLGRVDGKRSHWKTAKVTVSHERDMYQSLLSDYEASQRSLMLENAELKKVMQQMKKEMIHILSPEQRDGAALDNSHDQDGSDTERAELGRESLDKSCEVAREQLTNSIRRQWRKIRSHMETLDSQATHNQEDVIPIQTHDDEMERMRQEVLQCRQIIQTQQQLLQQQLDCSFDEDTATLLNGCYTLEEKERLKEEWALFKEQKRNFERERNRFTEAAISLAKDKRAFEEDRAAWFKNQFLSMTPFAGRRRGSSSDGHSSLSIRSEPEVRMSSTYSTNFSTPKPVPRPAAPSTSELYRKLRLIPETSSRYRGSWSSVEDGDNKSEVRTRCQEIGVFSLGKEDTSP